MCQAIFPYEVEPATRHKKDILAAEEKLLEKIKEHITSGEVAGGLPGPYFTLEDRKEGFIEMLRSLNVGTYKQDEKTIEKHIGGQRLLVAYVRAHKGDPEKFRAMLATHFYTKNGSSALEPNDTLYACAKLSEIAREMAKAPDLNEEQKRETSEMLATMQKTLDEMLGTLDLFEMDGGWTLLDEVLGSGLDKGGFSTVLRQLVIDRCDDLLTGEELQSFFVRHYRGTLLGQLQAKSQYADGRRFTWRIMMGRWLIFIGALLVNVVFVPFAVRCHHRLHPQRARQSLQQQCALRTHCPCARCSDALQSARDGAGVLPHDRLDEGVGELAEGGSSASPALGKASA